MGEEQLETSAVHDTPDDLKRDKDTTESADGAEEDAEVKAESDGE
jgi:hypothetical protein